MSEASWPLRDLPMIYSTHQKCRTLQFGIICTHNGQVSNTVATAYRLLFTLEGDFA